MIRPGHLTQREASPFFQRDSQYPKHRVESIRPCAESKHTAQALSSRPPKDQDPRPPGSSAGHHEFQRFDEKCFSRGPIYTRKSRRRCIQQHLRLPLTNAPLAISSFDIGSRVGHVTDRTGREDMPLWDSLRADLQGSSGLRLTRRLKDGNALRNAQFGSFATKD